MNGENIWVVGGSKSYGSVVSHLGNIVTKEPKTSEEIQSIGLLMFTGGEDVHPHVYGGVDDGVSYSHLPRDVEEMNAFDLAVKHGIKITGICRGSQFICVMCGGEMYQDIKGHAGHNHDTYFPALDAHVEVTSTHHQLVKPNWTNAKLVGYSSKRLSNRYIGPDCEEAEEPTHEVEALFYPKFNAFAVQFHPEFMRSDEPGAILYKRMITDFVNEDSDVFESRYCVDFKKPMIASLQ